MLRLVSICALALAFGLSTSAYSLTFKSDGTVVQKSGEVVTESYAQRYAKQFFLDAEKWPVARGRGSDPDGYIGDKLFLPGTPLMVVRNIKKGDSYVEALMNQNGFLDKASLQRFIVANANPEFMEELGLTEAQAVAYVGNVDLTNLQGLSADYAQQLQNVISEIESVVADSVEKSVEDAVKESVEEAVEDAVDNAVSDALDAAFDDWWAGYIQDLVDSGATILEQTDSSVTYTYD